MGIQSRFVVTAGVFYVVLASAGLMPIAAASPWPEDINGSSSPVEHAALPPPADDRLRPDLLGEQPLDGVGSVAEQEAASETEPTGIDPWAEAYAESSRIAAVPQPVKSSYSVSLNPQVQYFLDRFTGDRRDIVTLWVGRAGRYLGMIGKTHQQLGLATGDVEDAHPAPSPVRERPANRRSSREPRRPPRLSRRYHAHGHAPRVPQVARPLR